MTPRRFIDLESPKANREMARIPPGEFTPRISQYVVPKRRGPKTNRFQRRACCREGGSTSSKPES